MRAFPKIFMGIALIEPNFGGIFGKAVWDYLHGSLRRALQMRLLYRFGTKAQRISMRGSDPYVMKVLFVVSSQAAKLLEMARGISR